MSVQMLRSAILIFAAFAGSFAALAQQAPPPSEVPGHNTPGYQVYNDQFSTNCSRGNTSPYKGMNPLICHGVMAPADSSGRCSLRGMRLLKQVGNTCYYCQPLNPPINGIVIPVDQLQRARVQGFTCGVDQANPRCMAVCYRDSGGGAPYIPKNRYGLPLSGSASVPRNPYGLPRPALGGSDPCRPFGPGGYDYCQNPAGTQPKGCDCSKRWPGGRSSSGQIPNPLPWEQPAYAAPPAPKPASWDSIPCLYSTRAYIAGQVMRLEADSIVENRRPNTYNCFQYAKTFITGGFAKNPFMVRDWLAGQGFLPIAQSTSLGELHAKLGDLVLVGNPTPQTSEWLHVGIVIGVDRAGRITRIRQKPNETDCVKDTTAEQFQSIFGADEYHLWGNSSLDFLGKLAQ